MTVIPAIYYDGVAPVPRAVVTEWDAEDVTLRAGDACLGRWDARALVTIERPHAMLPGVLAPGPESAERLVIADARPWHWLPARHAEHWSRALRRRAWRATILGCAIMTLAVVITVFMMPRFAREIVDLIPIDLEQPLAEAAAQSVIARHAQGRHPAECRHPPGRDALSILVGDVLAGLDHPINVRVIVVNAPEVNAMATLGGVVAILRGQIEESESPEELAGVIAHEVGHVVARHPLLGLLSTAPIDLTFGVLFGSMLGSSAFAGVTSELAVRRNSRADEREADALALAIMRGAMIDPEPLARSYRAFARRTVSPPAYLATHPPDDERAAFFSNHRWRVEPLLTDAQWRALRAICR